MDITSFNEGLIAFLAESPTPFHAVASMKAALTGKGFSELKETETWDLSPGGYFVTRNQSSIIAFKLGKKSQGRTGIRLVGAHTDSPCLKVKPLPALHKQGYLQLGIEVYGGALLNPWFDRDLALAGRVTCRHADGKVRNHLVNIAEPIAVIPSLAIHLDREANKSRSVNPQTDMAPILLQAEEKGSLEEILAAELPADAKLLATELFFYDANPPRIIGRNRDFIAAARLDNLLSCYTGLAALLASSGEEHALLVCNDHEEVGSASAAGAEGTFLTDVLERLLPPQERALALARSLLISTDNAHGIHPNYPDKHDGNHGPLLNQGPAVKHNANQRYATNSETAGYFKSLCQDAGVKVQEFVNRADMACGSTIGPITAKTVGIRTLDVGVPTFAMHSIRELAGVKDASALCQALTGFFDDKGPLGAETA